MSTIKMSLLTSTIISILAALYIVVRSLNVRYGKVYLIFSEFLLLTYLFSILSTRSEIGLDELVNAIGAQTLIVALYVSYYKKDMLNVNFYDLISLGNIRYGLISNFNDYNSESLSFLSESIKELNQMFANSSRHKTIAALVIDEEESSVKFTCVYWGNTPLEVIDCNYLDEKNIKVEDYYKGKIIEVNLENVLAVIT